MKKFAFFLMIPLLLAACSDPVRQYSEGWQQQKASCAAGNFSVCSTLGHQAREQAGGVTVIEPKPFSAPIVD